jgi:hypothetical protein
LRHIYILEEGSVHVVGLLLDSRSELEKLVGDGLVRALEDIDQAARVWVRSCLKRVALEGSKTHEPE